MPKIGGYTLYTCDRNKEHTAYARDDEPEAEGWHVVRRVDRNGNGVERLLCEKCYGEYQALSEAQDKDFAGFMNGGGAGV